MTEYTRMSFFVLDKHVMAIKRTLMAYGVKDLQDQPLVNAAEDGSGAVVAKTRGRVEDLLLNWLRESGKESVQADDIRDFQITHGRSPGGYSGALATGISAGLLKHITKSGKGSRATYTVTAKAKNPETKLS